jgi:hypothetical protein
MDLGAQPDKPGADDGARPAIDPVDAAWLHRRSSSGPLVLGVLGLLTAPILLGLLFASLGLRSGIDQIRRGIRGVVPALGVIVSAAGLVVGVASALLWGALLSGVLLARDAMRTAEGWRGTAVEATPFPAQHDGAQTMLRLSAGNAPHSSATDTTAADEPAAGPAHVRRAIVFVRLGTAPSDDLLRELALASLRHPDVPLVIVDAEQPGSAVAEAALATPGFIASRDYFVGSDATLPTPLTAVAATPTIVLLAPDGRIEHAVIGGLKAGEIEKLLRGDAALEDEALSPKGIR